MDARTCRRWQVINTRRVTCALPYLHPGECQPHLRVRLAGQMDELARLLIEHDEPDVVCAPCQSANASLRAGADPAAAVDGKCDWYRGTLAASQAGWAELMRLDAALGLDGDGR